MLRTSRHESADRTAAWKPLKRIFLLYCLVLTNQARFRAPALKIPGGLPAFAARGAMARQEARVLYWTRVNPYNTPRAAYQRTKVL